MLVRSPDMVWTAWTSTPAWSSGTRNVVRPRCFGASGFVRASKLGLPRPPEALNDYGFQVIVLEPDARLPQGRVVYSESFKH